jgi:GrpB-like predicted nucleotidyltransferase (UPF0157 family)
MDAPAGVVDYDPTWQTVFEGPYHHLSVVVDGSPACRDHLDLRDHLRTHPDDAARYAARKREVAYLLQHDREAYVEAKSSIIQEILDRARGEG